MLKKIVLSFILILKFSDLDGQLVVNKIAMRIPRERDYGLIFDMKVTNSGNEDVSYQVRPNGVCSLKFGAFDEMYGAGKIVGGDFGYITPGESDVCSLIWPTTSLYNRVGKCPIEIIYSNDRHSEIRVKRLVHFDTTFESLDPEERTFRKLKYYQDCKNYDKDYLKECLPVDCEERYFGRRSFYNKTTQRCQRVPKCKRYSEYYDTFSNECVNPASFITEKDIQDIKMGKYVNNYLELKPSHHRKPPMDQSSNDGKNKRGVQNAKVNIVSKNRERVGTDDGDAVSLVDIFGGKKSSTNKRSKEKKVKVKSRDKTDPDDDDWEDDETQNVKGQYHGLEDDDYDNFDSRRVLSKNLDRESGFDDDECESERRKSGRKKPKGHDLNCDDFTDGECKKGSRHGEAGSTVTDRGGHDGMPYWLKGILNGLVIVVATIAIYILICFCIYLVASWLSHDKCKKRAKSRLSRSVPEEIEPQNSTPSLLSSHH